MEGQNTAQKGDSETPELTFCEKIDQSSHYGVMVSTAVFIVMVD